MVAHILLIIETVSVVNLVLTSMIGLYHAVTASGYSCRSTCCGNTVVELSNRRASMDEKRPSIEIKLPELPIAKNG